MEGMQPILVIYDHPSFLVQVATGFASASRILKIFFLLEDGTIRLMRSVRVGVERCNFKGIKI